MRLPGRSKTFLAFILLASSCLFAGSGRDAVAQQAQATERMSGVPSTGAPAAPRIPVPSLAPGAEPAGVDRSLEGQVRVVVTGGTGAATNRSVCSDDHPGSEDLGGVQVTIRYTTAECRGWYFVVWSLDGDSAWVRSEYLERLGPTQIVTSSTDPLELQCEQVGGQFADQASQYMEPDGPVAAFAAEGSRLCMVMAQRHGQNGVDCMAQSFTRSAAGFKSLTPEQISAWSFLSKAEWHYSHCMRER